MSNIANTILQCWISSRKTKKTPSNWVSGDAPCCVYNGTSADTRQRGGMALKGDGIVYSCFNCGFKATWQPGRLLSKKMRVLLSWIGVDPDIIGQLSFDALRNHDSSIIFDQQLIPQFTEAQLPDGANPIESYLATDNIPNELIEVIDYLDHRKIIDYGYDFYWSPTNPFKNRVIIPFYNERLVVGYTARSINKQVPKYLSFQQPGYVFNLERQTHDKAFVIVCEGPIDAISIDGVAVLGANINEQQNWLIKQLYKEVILVPDRDREGFGTVEQAIKYGWSVSMPDWPVGIKDINDAVCTLGRLATLWLIIHHKESYEVKIRLLAKQWFKGIEYGN